MSTVRLELSDGVAEITLDNPPVNALGNETREELLRCLATLQDDPAVRALIITGAGDKSFCAGADMREHHYTSDEDALARQAVGARAMRAVETFPAPTIAAINGYALGGGTELALCCDLRVACYEARFGAASVKVGRLASTQRLPRLVGMAKAKELIFTGRQFSALEAEKIGLVSAVVAKKDLLPTARALAREIAANAPVSVRLAKRALTEGITLTLEEGLALEASYWLQTVNTEDAKEANRAFFEKRPPRFRGV